MSNPILDLFGNPIDPETIRKHPRARNRDGSYINNPMVTRCGAGPEGARCKECKHLIRKKYAKVYFKCSFRGDSNGPKTDHRANWPACGKYEIQTPNTDNDETSNA